MQFSFQTVWILLGVTLAHLVLIGAFSPSVVESAGFRPKMALNQTHEISEKAAPPKTETPAKPAEKADPDAERTIEVPKPQIENPPTREKLTDTVPPGAPLEVPEVRSFSPIAKP